MLHRELKKIMFQLEVPLGFGNYFKWCLNNSSGNHTSLLYTCVRVLRESEMVALYFSHVSTEDYDYASFRSVKIGKNDSQVTQVTF